MFRNLGVNHFDVHPHLWQDSFFHWAKKTTPPTVDGQNPAPPRMMIIPLFIGFYTSQVVQDFVHQQ